MHRRPANSGEFSGGKPTRLSRIAQPIRRPSLRERTLERASSLEQLSHLSAPLATRSRSSSATPLRTPIRTPNRPIPQSATGSAVTGEKERPRLDDKKLLQTQLSRLNEYLGSMQDVLGKDFIQRGGLKTMSTKQFVTIFSHFLKLIASKRLSIGANYPDDIAKALDQIDYPYTINKSWLKTPSAPHALNNIIMMFGWMLDFVRPESSCDEFEQNYITATEDMPDEAYLKKFKSSAKLGFPLWDNSKNEEFDRLKKELIDTYLQKRDNVERLESLQANIKRINEEITAKDRGKFKEKLKEELSELENELVKSDGQFHLKEKQLSRLIKTCDESTNKIARFKEISESIEKQIAGTQDSIKQLENIVKSQTMTTKDRAKLISQIQQLKQHLESRKMTALKVQEMDESNQVQYSRVVKKLIELVSEFNIQIYQIVAVCNKSKVQGPCLNLDSDVSIEDQLDELKPFLEELKHSILEETKELAQQIAELAKKSNEATYKHDKFLEEELKTILQSCDECKRNIESIGEEIANTEACRAKELEQLTRTLDTKIDANSELEEKNRLHDDEIELLRQENKEMATRIKAKCDEFLQAKRSNLMNMKENMKRLTQTFNDISLKLNLKFEDPN